MVNSMVNSMFLSIKSLGKSSRKTSGNSLTMGILSTLALTSVGTVNIQHRYTLHHFLISLIAFIDEIRQGRGTTLTPLNTNSGNPSGRKITCFVTQSMVA